VHSLDVESPEKAFLCIKNMYVLRAMISNEPFDAISASSDLSHLSRFSPRELVVDLKTLILALAAAVDANLPGGALLIAASLFIKVIGRMDERGYVVV
jgi:hypothetical protein